VGGGSREAALPGGHVRSLFAYLVIRRGRLVRRDELAAALWAEAPPASCEASLNTLVSRLRKGLEGGVVRGRSELTLELPADSWIDIEIARDEVRRAELAVDHADWRMAADAAANSLEISERELLPGVDTPWIDEERRRVEDLRMRALECLAAAGLGLGGARLSDAEHASRAMIAADPYRETGYRHLMEVLAEHGRVAEALLVFDDMRRLLRDELGASPGMGLRSVHERLLSGQVEPRQARPRTLLRSVNARGVNTVNDASARFVVLGGVAR
jgi:pentatricopeptide repeat protein